MNPIPYRSLGVAAFLFLLGCQGMPKAAPTGHVIDVALDQQTERARASHLD